MNSMKKPISLSISMEEKVKGRWPVMIFIKIYVDLNITGEHFKWLPFWKEMNPCKLKRRMCVHAQHWHTLWEEIDMCAPQEAAFTACHSLRSMHNTVKHLVQCMCIPGMHLTHGIRTTRTSQMQDAQHRHLQWNSSNSRATHTSGSNHAKHLSIRPQPVLQHDDCEWLNPKTRARSTI